MTKNHFIVPRFTAREREIIKLLVKGFSLKEIADLLFISVNTAKTHRQNIYAKSGVNKVTKLRAYAVKNGLIKKKP